MTATITAKALRLALRATRNFVDGEDMVGLHTIRIEAGGGVLTATATDRTAVGHVRRPAEGDLAPIYLDNRACDLVVAGIANVPTDSVVSLAADDDFLIVSFGGNHLNIKKDPRGEWPDVIWPKLVEHLATTGSATKSAEMPPFGITPDNLEKVISAARLDGDLLELRIYLNGRTNAIRFEVDTWLLCLVMPRVTEAATARRYTDVPNIPLALPTAVPA